MFWIELWKAYPYLSMVFRSHLVHTPCCFSKTIWLLCSSMTTTLTTFWTSSRLSLPYKLLKQAVGTMHNPARPIATDPVNALWRSLDSAWSTASCALLFLPVPSLGKSRIIGFLILKPLPCTADFELFTEAAKRELCCVIIDYGNVLVLFRQWSAHVALNLYHCIAFIQTVHGYFTLAHSDIVFLDVDGITLTFLHFFFCWFLTLWFSHKHSVSDHLLLLSCAVYFLFSRHIASNCLTWYGDVFHGKL